MVEQFKQKEKGAHDFRFMLRVFWKIQPLPFFCFLLYFQTFLMFPGVVLKIKVANLSFSWISTLLVFVFNCFDTIGKHLGNYRQIYSMKSTIILIFARFLLYAFLILFAVDTTIPVLDTDWFPFLIVGLFGLTHGFCTSCIMILAPEIADDEEKETAGFIMSFPLFVGKDNVISFNNIENYFLGISASTFCALSLAKI